MSIKGLIFDFDGVILDSVKIKEKAFKKIVNKYGLTVSEKFMKYHNKNLGISRELKFEYFYKNIIKKKFTKKM